MRKELYEFWDKYLRACGYRLKVYIIDLPGGMLGDIGVKLGLPAS